MTLLRLIAAYLSAWMRRIKWLAHPITVFVLLQLVWLAITLIWVIWFVGEGAEIAKLAQSFGRKYFEPNTVLVILIVGCVLLGVILVGTIMLFVFGQRQTVLARQQRSFVSSVTHELKSPLANLQLTLETWKKRPVDKDTANKMADMAISDIDRLRRTVDQILVAGRLDKGVEFLEKDKASIDPRESIEAMLPSLRYLDADIVNRVTIECPKDLAIACSERTFSLIMTNLIENAVKYSPKSEPINVKIARNGDQIQIEVRDHGYGLDKKEKRRIFKMFHRTESADKRAIPGTGLGLYIVKSVVSVLGGRVWAESEGRNHGSSFFVSLPG